MESNDNDKSKTKRTFGSVFACIINFTNIGGVVFLYGYNISPKGEKDLFNTSID